MRKLINSFLSLALVATAAASISCGSSSSSDVCSHLASSAASLITKAQPCGLTETAPSESACEAGISNCTASDETQINAALTCIDNLPTCSTANEQTFGQDLEACGAMLQTGISAACQGAIGTGSSSSADAAP